MGQSNVLYSGECIYSENLRYRACYKPDGTFCVENTVSSPWCLPSVAEYPYVVVVTEKGLQFMDKYLNFYDFYPTQNQVSCPSCKLLMNNDGNLVFFPSSSPPKKRVALTLFALKKISCCHLEEFQEESIKSEE